MNRCRSSTTSKVSPTCACTAARVPATRSKLLPQGTTSLLQAIAELVEPLLLVLPDTLEQVEVQVSGQTRGGGQFPAQEIAEGGDEQRRPVRGGGADKYRQVAEVLRPKRLGQVTHQAPGGLDEGLGISEAPQGGALINGASAYLGP